MSALELAVAQENGCRKLAVTLIGSYTVSPYCSSTGSILELLYEV